MVRRCKQLKTGISHPHRGSPTAWRFLSKRARSSVSAAWLWLAQLTTLRLVVALPPRPLAPWAYGHASRSVLPLLRMHCGQQSKRVTASTRIVRITQCGTKARLEARHKLPSVVKTFNFLFLRVGATLERVRLTLCLLGLSGRLLLVSCGGVVDFWGNVDVGGI
jgi:hypothetical protein